MANGLRNTKTKAECPLDFAKKSIECRKKNEFSGRSAGVVVDWKNKTI